ncbi:MAG: methylenetetrahydrofolate reductase [Actinomycetota bacterium]|nr:methylenetetrahydrofolate reductase [Actinomycetota bacterium]
MTVGGRLAALLAAGEFAVTGEVVPPVSGSGVSVSDHARALVGYVDAANVTDNPTASAHMSPLAGARFLHDAGIEPTLQITARDRNRLALTADLLGAWALGARNVFCLSGDPMRIGDDPSAPAVSDLDVQGLIGLALRLREDGTTLTGKEVADPPRFFIGVAEMPLADPYQPQRLEQKLDAGADFVMTQIAYDVEALAAWADRLRPEGLFERAKVLIGITPLKSVKQATFMHDKLPGVRVPAEMLSALLDAGEGAAEVGLRLTIDVVKAILQIPGISGVHLMGMGDDAAVRKVVEGAGLFPRPVR